MTGKDNTTKQTRRGVQAAFTLVELLVVIAIISLLASLLLPSLKKAKEMANRVKCASNLRQWGIAVILYTNDYKDSFVPADMRAGAYYWYDLLAPYVGAGGASSDGTGTGDYMQNRLEVRGVLHNCPSYIQTDPIRSSYTYNSDLSPRIQLDGTTHGYDAFAAMKISNVTKLSSTLMLADENFGYSSFGHIASTNPSWIGCAVDYRHNNGANVLFVAGHVDWMENPGADNLLDIAYTGATIWNGTIGQRESCIWE